MAARTTSHIRLAVQDVNKLFVLESLWPGRLYRMDEAGAVMLAGSLPLSVNLIKLKRFREPRLKFRLGTWQDYRPSPSGHLQLTLASCVAFTPNSRKKRLRALAIIIM